MNVNVQRYLFQIVDMMTILAQWSLPWENNIVL